MRLRWPRGRSREPTRELSLGRARARGRIVAGAALAIAVAVVVVLVLRSQGSPSQSGSQAAGSTGLGVVTVRRRNLVASDTESGTLGYANPQTVYNRISGTITWLPSVGHVIMADQVLYRVADKPVILMYGSTPAFRDLDSHDPPGADITQLNRNLVRLGFDADGIVVDDEWQAATTVGVEELQESIGVTPTGKLALGRIVFLPGPQLVSQLDATVGGTGSGGSGSGGSPAAAPLAASPSARFVSLDRPAATGSTTTTGTETSSTTTATTSTATTSTATTSTATTGTHTATTATTPASTTGSTTTPTRHRGTTPMSTPSPSGSGNRHPGAHAGTPSAGAPSSTGALRSAIAQLSSQVAALRRQLQAQDAAHRGSHSGQPGSNHHGSEHSSSAADASAAAILQTSSPTLVVTVDLPASSQSEAVVGSAVTVLMPDGSTAKGTIASVSRVAESSSSSGSGGSGDSGSGSGDSGSGSSTIPVTIRLKGHHAGARLDQAAVSVDFVKSSARHVLSVPVTALVATSGQTYALQQASPPHTLIPVRTGLFAAGYVQVSGKGVVPGLRVTDSEG
ncbi:MAG TPA: hypothetical protein VFW09_09665 [Solirubrobacteraceae bacterium]|nr:hypothetical protein [Solirubrobacteraceae bacterium]